MISGVSQVSEGVSSKPEAGLILLWNPSLRNKPCREIDDFGKDLEELFEVMKHSCFKHEGVGIAAPQLGYFVQAALIHWPLDKEPELICNPVIDPIRSNGDEKKYEACLSLPGCTNSGEIIKNQARVSRMTTVAVSYLDIHGEPVELLERDPVRARVIQHEVDHLSGIFFIDRCNSIERNCVLSNYYKFVKLRVKPLKEPSNVKPSV